MRIVAMGLALSRTAPVPPPSLRDVSAAWREACSQWLRGLMERFKADAADISQRSGVPPSTVYRILNGQTNPQRVTVDRIANAFAVAGPDSGPRADGFAEPDAEPFQGDPPAELAPRTPNQSVWRIGNRALELAGVLPGDLVLLDQAEAAKPGDVVFVQVYDFERGGAQTRIRLFDGLSLTPRSLDPAFAAEPALRAGDRGVHVVGPVRALLRLAR
jgi:transcriptional regulator with XRE-family HTH domain